MKTERTIPRCFKTGDYRFFALKSLLRLHCFKAIVAVNRLIEHRLKGNLCLLTTITASDRGHLAWFIAEGIPLIVAALFAPFGLIGKAFVGVEFLLGSSKNKLFTAVLASQNLIFVCHSFLGKSLGRFIKGERVGKLGYA